MRKRRLYSTLFITAFVWLASCSDDTKNNVRDFNPEQPIVIDEFYPDSGGIATPMVLEGSNFGTDTTGMKVYFEDVDGIKHRAGLVSSNGSKIYLFVPSGLTYKRNMNLIVERSLPNGKEYMGKAKDQFIYRTQTSVSTVVGMAAPDNRSLPTVGGDLATSTLSSPNYICLDDEDNIFITEHTWYGGPGNPTTTANDEKGNAVNGNIVMASLKSNSVIVLKYATSAAINAPAFSDEKDNETICVPDDNGTSYYSLTKVLSYAPRYLTMIKSEETKDIDENNWKHCFVVNKLDNQIYTVMFKGQLVRINPKNRTAQILLKQIGKQTSTDYYLAFSPVAGQENMLYMCMGMNNQIWRVDVGNLEGKDKNSYNGEPYAGKAITEGITEGKGWEDGLLKNAKFNYPHQICFTKEGKLYIADTGNACIRVIDTTLPRDKAIVSTPIGLPGAAGYKDGGPDIAKFNLPIGVAVSADGRIVYVADTQNKVIRKLSIQ